MRTRCALLATMGWCFLLASSLVFVSQAAPLSSRPSSIVSAEDITADCYLRSFAIEFATWLQPEQPVTNWTAAIESGFEMATLCDGQVYGHTDGQQRPTTASSSTSTATAAGVTAPVPPILKRDRASKDARQLMADCRASIYVDGTHGDDSQPGSLQQPVRSIAAGLQLTRQLRAEHAISSICLVLRQATYYLGSVWAASPNFPSSELSSRIGAIALTAADSGLTITAFPGEENAVILSAGTLIEQLQWTVYRHTPLGDILQAPLPAGLDLDFRASNELYMGTTRLIRAKYPNSDPSTSGLWTEPTGWIDAAEQWLPPRQYPPVADVTVDSPARNGTFFPNFHTGIGGRCIVFEPSLGYWCSDSPPAGASFSNPSGLVDKSHLQTRMANWSHPETGFVHVMHGAYWGSWVFAIESADNGTITFGVGGTQEGRGAGGGADYYVSNVLEELDSPSEWFIDPATSTLYLLPNQSQPVPSSLVVSQLACLVSVTGDVSQPAEDITIHGLTLTHTANTYMRLHEMPSGGDFSLHRGAAVFITHSSNLTFTHNRLTQLGSNGLTLSDWNLDASIVNNEISFIGGSGVQIVGSAWSIDAVTNTDQPRGTHVQSNLIHDIGIYIKQSAGVVQAVARASRLEGNVLYNAPRMQTCFNDGFAGGNVLAYNLGFNGMRETSDAGVFESWDRQPYLTSDGGMGPSLSPAWNHEHHNYAYVNYRTDAVINHDDGSSWYEDYFNLFVYCGYQTYLGHNKHYHDELTLYPDYVDSRPCFETNQSPGALQFDELYTHNSCVQRKELLTYGIRGCRVESIVADCGLSIDYSTFYYPEGAQPYIPCTQNGQWKNFSLDEWRTTTGLDVHSVVALSPPIETLIHWARQLLINNTNVHSQATTRMAERRVATDAA